jgi:hypothetical protein
MCSGVAADNEGEQSMKWHSRRATVAVTVAITVTALWAITATFAAAAGKDSWLWQVGDDQGSVGVSSTNESMDIDAAGDLDVTAGHLRMVTRDGNYEFEHSISTTYSLLNSYYLGTPTRTPIAVGGYADGQDVVSLIVRGVQGQKNDLQQWVGSGKVDTAIDGNGRLRIGSVTLTTRIVNGKAELLAVLPGGKVERLAAAR